MTDEEFARLDALAGRLVSLVGATPLVVELLQQAEVEEAISVLRENAVVQGIALPDDLLNAA